MYGQTVMMSAVVSAVKSAVMLLLMSAVMVARMSSQMSPVMSVTSAVMQFYSIPNPAKVQSYRIITHKQSLVFLETYTLMDNQKTQRS